MRKIFDDLLTFIHAFLIMGAQYSHNHSIVFWKGTYHMGDLLKKSEDEVEHLEEEAIHLGKKAAQNKMSIVGTIASGLSICMYVSYIPQIMGNLSGHPGDWIQPFVAFINCTMWVGYGFFREQREWPLVFANLPGIVFGLTAALTAYF